MEAQPTQVTDGRHARRERNRRSVVDALLDLILEEAEISTESIAGRAGVSISSLFRYFDSIDDLQREAIATHFSRSASLFEIEAVGEGPRHDRIARYVDARIVLHASVAPIARAARARATAHAAIEDALLDKRKVLAERARRHFSVELGALTAAQADDLLGTVDTLTSFEAWDLLRIVHGRTDAQIGRAWRSALDALLPAV